MRDIFPSWLPCFPGFYNTALSSEVAEERFGVVKHLLYKLESSILPAKEEELSENLLCKLENNIVSAKEKEVSENLFQASLDFITYLINIYPFFYCVECYIEEYKQVTVDRFAELVKSFLQEVDIDVEFEELTIRYPPYYNFKNDAVQCDITVNPQHLLDYVDEHLDEFRIYLKNTYKSCDGFASYYTYDIWYWREALLNAIAESEDKPKPYDHSNVMDCIPGTDHLIGSVLQFILINENKYMWKDQGFYEFIDLPVECIDLRVEPDFMNLCMDERFINILKNYVNELNKVQEYKEMNPGTYSLRYYEDHHADYMRSLAEDVKEIFEKVKKGY